MSGPTEKQGSKPAGIQKPKQAEPNAWERQKHEQLTGSIDALTDQLRTNQESEDRSDKDHAFREKLTIWLVFFALISSLVGDGIFYWTMAEARAAAAKAHSDSVAALSVSQETEYRQLRAYVGISIPPKTSDNNMIPPAVPLINLGLRNAGQTPARKATHLSGIVVDVFPLPENYKFPDVHPMWPGSPATILPGPMDELGIHVSKMSPLTPLELAEIKTINWRLYAYGTITYDDIFGETHHTNYCIAFMLPNAETIDRSTCNIHNEAD